jgi:hypothetical protein
MAKTIPEAIKSINPEALFEVDGNPFVQGQEIVLDINKIRWLDGNPTNITKEQILAKQTELQTKYDAQDYARKRQAEYPKIGDQLDKIYHEGIDAWKADMITPIKNKYPKG